MDKMRWSICLVIIFMSTPVVGEFYRYVDKNGNIIFTDDLGQVPVEQRPKAKTYIESKGETKEQGAISTGEKEQTDQDASAEPAQLRSELDKKKKELDKEYKILIKEKEALSKAVKMAKTRVQIQKFNKRASRFAENVAEYEKRKKAFAAEIDKYHFRIKQDFEKKLEDISEK